NADAFVSDRDHHKLPGWQILNGCLLCRALAEIFTSDVKRSASRHRLLCVHDQIGDDLTDLTGINFRRPKLMFQVALATALRSAQTETDRLRDQSGDGCALV